MLRNKKIIAGIIVLALFMGLTSSSQDLMSAIKLSESEQFDSAHKVFDALISQEPNNGENYYYYGECWLKQFLVDSMSVSLKEVTEQALKYYNKGIEKDSLDPLNYVGAGRVYVLLHKKEQANIMFARAIDKLPWKNYKKSDIPLSKQALTFAKIAQARLKAIDRNKDNLLELITKAIERDESNVDVYLIKGDIYLEYYDGSNAIIAYNKAFDLDTLSLRAILKIGQVNVRGRTYDEGLKFYKKAIEIDSNFAPAFRERAELYGLANQWSNASKDYEKFLELSGNNTYAKYRYASFLFMAKKYEEALKIINEVLTIDPSYTILYRLAAYSYYETDQYPEGLKAIDTFFKEIKPEKIINSDYVYYGDLLTKTNKYSEGIQKYMLAFELDTTNCDMLSKVARAHAKLKEYENVIKDFEIKAANKCEIGLNDYYEWGKAHFFLKQWGKADTILRNAYEKKQDWINIIKFLAWANANQDTTSVLGMAKPFYEALITQCLIADSVKYLKDISEGYRYLMYYYFKQYNLNKKCEDAKNAVLYCDKMLAIDPRDSNSIDIKRSLAGKCPE